MKILLAYISGMANRRDPYINLLPTGLCSLQARLREAGFDSVIGNFSGWSDAAIIRQLAALKPDVAGISQWTHNRHASLALAQLVRKENPRCTVIMGGAHATFCYDAILRDQSPVDCVVLGEGEDTLLEIVRHLDNGDSWRDVNGIAYRSDAHIVVTPQRLPLDDLDNLPMAAASLEFSLGIDLLQQAEFILTARGCPAGCHFCSSPAFWKRKVRFRSPAKIVEEITYIRDRFGLIYFSLRDETFTADRTRVIEFCRLLVERRIFILWNCQSRVTALDEELLVWMKQAGCECIQLGVESGSTRMLSRLGKTITPVQAELAAKMIRKVGINLSVYLISDIPGETEEDIGQTIDLIRRMRPDDGYVSPLAYFPGTRMFQEAVADGSLQKNVFEVNFKEAVYVVGNAGKGSRRLLRCLEHSAPRDAERFRQQKELLGYCYVTNVLAGEFYRQRSNYAAAEQEFREIVDREPDNPWGWYLLGELFSEKGSTSAALECYRAVCRLVPEHFPSCQALQAKK